MPWEKVITAARAMAVDLNMPWGPPWSPWDSTVDGWFLRDTPADAFKAGEQNSVPFIMGAYLGEVTVPAFVWMPWVIPGYVKLFAGARGTGGKAYAYIFDQVPMGWKSKAVTCNHGRELPYVFGDLDPNS